MSLLPCTAVEDQGWPPMVALGGDETMPLMTAMVGWGGFDGTQAHLGIGPLEIKNGGFLAPIMGRR